MARREKYTNQDEGGGKKQSWGTLEELLLVCAVNRYGTNSWDSIAMELQNRTSPHDLRAFFTSHSCKQKYRDLRRRFTNGRDDVDDDDDNSVRTDGDDDDERLKTMVDELRKLRVAELRREVELHDVSIESLQSKVKRLEEEREQSLNLKEGETDLPNQPEVGVTGEPDGKSPEEFGGKSASGEVSGDRENRSFNESNSTNQKGEDRPTDRENPDIKLEPEEAVCGLNEPEPVQNGTKSVFDYSLTVKLPEAVQGRESAELCDSVAESKRERKEGTKHNSDVQSSASLSSRKRRRRNRFPIASSGEDEPESEKVSPAIKPITVKPPEPLIKFLGLIRSHKHGSVLERRLRSQETEKYRKLIRQHMDLQMVQSRLDNGMYSDMMMTQYRFFRDLLLLFNNAIIFFKNNSSEHIAAYQLRKLVLKEMAKTIGKPITSTDPPVVLVQKQPNQNQLLFHSKPNKIIRPPPVPMVVCGKRSTSTSIRSLVPSEVKDHHHDEKLGTKKSIKFFGSKVEEIKVIEKQRITKERSSSELGRGSSTMSKKKGDLQNHDSNINVDDSKNKVEMRKESSTNKKHGAVSFLKKKNLSSEEDQNSTDDDDDKEEKRRRRRDGIRRGDGRGGRESAGRRGGGREQSSSTSVGRRGRPPKKPVVTSPPPPPPSEIRRGKRPGRELGGDSEALLVVEASGQSRKRSRK